MSVEVNINQQNVEVETTEDVINVNVNTSIVGVNNTEQVVEIAAATGIIYNANSLAGLSDVSANSASDGDVLQYVSSTGKWTKTSSINFGTW